MFYLFFYLVTLMLRDRMKRNDQEHAHRFATISELTSYAYCPRLCYFRQRYGESSGILSAAKEIYLSLRKGLDLKWAKTRFLYMGGNEEIFDLATEMFVIDSIEELSRYEPVEWEIVLVSERYRLRGVVDELVLENSEVMPLVISLRAPSKGVWFKDGVRVASQAMLLNDDHHILQGLQRPDRKIERGLVYHCFDGEIREVKVDRKMRFHVIKLVERVLRVKKGFIPEKIEGKKCLNCSYREDCHTTSSTFASRFL